MNKKKSLAGATYFLHVKCFLPCFSKMMAVILNLGGLDQDDGGEQWFCIFALDIYDWITLGDVKNFEARGCVGAYTLGQGMHHPLRASTATRLIVKVDNHEPLNPFGT